MRTKSLLRKEEYIAISNLVIDGDILDIGGSNKSGYQELIKGNHNIKTANIDSSYGVDVVFDAELAWPIKDRSYDAVLFINILEHLYNYKNAVNESYRVIRGGGTVFGVVPFMFNIHGCPDDYFRFSKSALEKIFREAGFHSIKITELGTGSFSVVYHVLISLVRWNWLANILIPTAKFFDILIYKFAGETHMSKKYMVLGYSFEALK